VPIFGRLFAGSADAYAYILESLEHYPGQRGVAELMQTLPTRGVRIHNLLGGAMGINAAERADA
jgi:ubiquinone/menaquinone biosynthesis C-methylase UbiE